MRDGRRSEDTLAGSRVNGRHDFDGSALGQRPRRSGGLAALAAGGAVVAAVSASKGA
jgi:hypothetical protein